LTLQRCLKALQLALHGLLQVALVYTQVLLHP
jgi:hypothetical protein